MSIIEHAKREFLKLAYEPIKDCEDDPNKWTQENVLEWLEVVSKQGHSGYSAPYIINLFKKLASQEPASPITCTDDEWDDVSQYGYGNPTFQNNRCSAVFKDGKNTKPYYIDAIVWVDQNGKSFTGNNIKTSRNEKLSSSQTIKLPFEPKRFYIDVIEHDLLNGESETYVKDESQLTEVWQYFEKPESLSTIRLKKLKKLSWMIKNFLMI